MRPWQFGRPKGPGFGISSHFYVTILAPTATLPTLLSILNPKGEGDAVEGYGAPLNSGDKEVLGQPMQRGAYVLACPDRKTVLKLLVLPKEETGFDPEVFARSELAQSTNPEVVARVRGAWFVLQMAYEIHDARVYPAVRFLLRIARRLGELTDGVIADPICQRYALPEEVLREGTTDFKTDVQDVVTVRFRTRADGMHCFTLGMQKFGLPELEIYGCDTVSEPFAVQLLLGLCQGSLNGNFLASGGHVGAPILPFEIRNGGLDTVFWKEVPCLELLPPTQHTAIEALIAWAEFQAASHPV